MAITKVFSVPSELPHARLYLDDIEDICQVFVEALREDRELEKAARPADELKTCFLMNGLNFDSIEDLKEYGGSTTELTVRVARQHRECELQIRSLAVPHLRIYCLGHEKGFATYAKIKAILDLRELKVRNITARTPDGFSILLPNLLLLAGVVLTYISQGHRAIVAALTFGTLALLLYFGVRPTRVYFVRSHERSKSRSQKTREYIEKIAFLIVGTLLGLALSKLFSR